MDARVEEADEVEMIDGRVASITFDLIKKSIEDTNQKLPFWKKLKTKF